MRPKSQDSSFFQPYQNPFVYEVGEEEAPTDWIMQAHDDFDASGENWNSHIYAFSRQ